MKLFRTRFGLKAMIAIVGLSSLVLWAWRVSRESQPDRLYANWLRDGDVTLRLQAARDLGGLHEGSAEGAHALAVSMLSDASPEVRQLSAASLANVVLNAADVSLIPDATAALIRALKDRDGKVRTAAAASLGRIGPAPDAAIPALLGAFADPDEWVRGEAVGSLGLIQLQAGIDRPEVREAIASAIRERGGHVREKGIYAFWASAEKSPEFSKGMMGNARTRGAAVAALAREGRLASQVIPELTRALDDPDPTIRREASQTLENAGYSTSPVLAPSP